MLVHPNHPNLDYFSFETHGFGDPPFHETPISVRYLESTSKCFTLAGTFLIDHQSSWHPTLKPWPFMADSAAEKDWKRTCLPCHIPPACHAPDQTTDASFLPAVHSWRRLRWPCRAAGFTPWCACIFVPWYPHPMIPSLLESKSLNDTTYVTFLCFAPGTGSSCHIGSEDSGSGSLTTP